MTKIAAAIIEILGGTVLTRNNVDPNLMTNSDYLLSVEYINGLVNRDVTVIDRHGIKLRVSSNPPFHGKYTGIFVIRRRYRLSARLIPSLLESVTRTIDDPRVKNTTVAAIRQAVLEYQNSENYKYHGEIEFHLDTGYTFDSFRINGNVIFSYETDLVLSILDSNEGVLHPQSQEYRKKVRLDTQSFETSKDDLYLKIEIIDNQGQYGTRFIKIGGEVFTIVPKRDPIRLSGVYVTKKTPSNGLHSFTELKEDFYTLEEAEKELLLYRNFEQAKFSAEDLSIMRKKELADAEHEIAKEKTALTREKNHFEWKKQIAENWKLVLGTIASVVSIIFTYTKAMKILSAALAVANTVKK